MQVVLAISVEKDGNLRAVYCRMGRWQGRPAGEVLSLRWRGPTPPLRVTSGSTGGLCVFEPPAGGHRYTSRGAGRKVPWVAVSKRTHLRAEGWPRLTVRLKRGRALVIRRTARRKYWIRTAASVRLDVGPWNPETLGYSDALVERPATSILPVQAPTKAKALGLELPPLLLARAGARVFGASVSASAVQGRSNMIN
jgi:hypothetical protein